MPTTALASAYSMTMVGAFFLLAKVQGSGSRREIIGYYRLRDRSGDFHASAIRARLRIASASIASCFVCNSSCFVCSLTNRVLFLSRRVERFGRLQQKLEPFVDRHGFFFYSSFPTAIRSNRRRAPDPHRRKQPPGPALSRAAARQSQLGRGRPPAGARLRARPHACYGSLPVRAPPRK